MFSSLYSLYPRRKGINTLTKLCRHQPGLGSSLLETRLSFSGFRRERARLVCPVLSLQPSNSPRFVVVIVFTCLPIAPWGTESAQHRQHTEQNAPMQKARYLKGQNVLGLSWVLSTPFMFSFEVCQQHSSFLGINGKIHLILFSGYTLICL